MGSLKSVIKQVVHITSYSNFLIHTFNIHQTMPLSKAIEGDWEIRTDKSPVPVKLTVKQFIGSDWMIACMVPKGNMMHCMVRETEEGLKQLKYSITGKEIPVEIMEMETIMSAFFEGEIKDIKREGDNWRMFAGDKDMLFSVDKDPK